MLLEARDHAAAEARYVQALDAWRTAHPTDDAGIADLLDGLASAVASQGDRGRALATLFEALTLRQRATPANPGTVATTLSDIAYLASDMGQHEVAALAFRAGLRIRAQLTLPLVPVSRALIQAAAEAQLRVGAPEVALEILELGAQALERVAAPGNPVVVAMAVDRGELLRDVGDLEAAREVLEQAVARVEEHDLAMGRPYLALGELEAQVGDPDRAAELLAEATRRARVRDDGARSAVHSLMALARHEATRDLGAALRVAREAVDLATEQVGPDHPLALVAAAELARLHRLTGDPAGALEAMRGIGERGWARHRGQVRLDVERARAAAALGQQADAVRFAERAVALAASNHVQLHGRVSPGEAEGLRRDLVVSRSAWLDVVDDPMVAFAGVLGVERLLVRPPDLPGAAALRDAVLGAALDAPEVATTTVPWRGEVAAVCGAIPEGTVLVDLVRGVEGLEAFVARSGCDVARVDLGDAARLEDLARGWRATLASTRELTARVDQRGRRLHEALWSPLAPHLDGADEVWVVSSGPLGEVPLGALPTAEGGYLIEELDIRRVVTAESVSRPRQMRLTSGALVVGEIDPTSPAAVALAPLAALADDPIGMALAMRPALCNDRPHGGRPEARIEASSVAAQLRLLGEDPVKVLHGSAATERAVLHEAPGRRIVHLATRVQAAACPASPDEAPALDPATLGGLLLSGADVPPVPFGGPDGVLTPAEIRTLDLRGTELVVVAGGPRADAAPCMPALLEAWSATGARWVLTSLWEPSELATATLVTDLYDGLERAADPADGLRQAQLRLLQANRAAWNEARPQDWAMMVASGH